MQILKFDPKGPFVQVAALLAWHHKTLLEPVMIHFSDFTDTYNMMYVTHPQCVKTWSIFSKLLAPDNL